MHSADVLPALRGEIAVDERYGQAIARARDLWARQRFFHWDLEFPEVFVDLAGRDWAADGGFDAMIGNPPYVRQESLAPLKPFLAANLPQVYHGIADLLPLLLRAGVRLLNNSGRLAYISSRHLRPGQLRRRLSQVAAHRGAHRDASLTSARINPSRTRRWYPAIHRRSAKRRHEQTYFRSLFIAGEVPTIADRGACRADGIESRSKRSAGQPEWHFSLRGTTQLLTKLTRHAGTLLGEVVNGRSLPWSHNWSQRGIHH